MKHFAIMDIIYKSGCFIENIEDFADGFNEEYRETMDRLLNSLSDEQKALFNRFLYLHGEHIDALRIAEAEKIYLLGFELGAQIMDTYSDLNLD